MRRDANLPVGLSPYKFEAERALAEVENLLKEMDSFVTLVNS